MHAADEHRKEVDSLELLLCASLLPAIREKYSSQFELLEIPEILRVDEREGQHGAVFFRKYTGRTYNDVWNEQFGGQKMGTELSEDMVRVIGDFRKVDLGWILGHPVGKRVGESSFNLNTWLTSFQSQAAVLTGWGFCDEELRRAEQFVSKGFDVEQRVLSNGDFYPRNLIKTETSVVLVDWGHWQGNRVCFLDYLPNVVAVAFIHMWNNDEWQRRFLGYAREALGVNAEDLRRAVLIKAFEQAIYWKDGPYWPPQVEHFKKALENKLPLD